MTIIIKTDMLSHSDIKKLHHFIKVTLYPLISNEVQSSTTEQHQLRTIWLGSVIAYNGQIEYSLKNVIKVKQVKSHYNKNAITNTPELN